MSSCKHYEGVVLKSRLHCKCRPLANGSNGALLNVGSIPWSQSNSHTDSHALPCAYLSLALWLKWTLSGCIITFGGQLLICSSNLPCARLHSVTSNSPTGWSGVSMIISISYSIWTLCRSYGARGAAEEVPPEISPGYLCGNLQYLHVVW